MRGTSPFGYAASRWEIISNGQEVRDKLTRLVWRRCAEGQVLVESLCTGSPTLRSQEGQLQNAQSVANETGRPWRLPSIKELVSTYNHAQSGGGDSFPANQYLGDLWTSTPIGSPVTALWFNTRTGLVASYFAGRYDSRAAWLVRDDE